MTEKINKLELILVIIILILIFFVGFLHLNTVHIYMMGFILFLVGILSTLFHISYFEASIYPDGLIGIAIMLSALLKEFLSSPILSDISIKLMIYMGINIFLFIIAIILTILCPKKMLLQKKYYIAAIILGIYFLSFTMSGFMPIIFGG